MSTRFTDWIAAGTGVVYSEATVTLGRPLGLTGRRRIRRGIHVGHLPTGSAELDYATAYANDLVRMKPPEPWKLSPLLVPVLAVLALLSVLSESWLQVAIYTVLAGFAWRNAYVTPRRQARYPELIRNGTAQLSQAQRTELAGALCRPAALSRTQLVAGQAFVGGTFFAVLLGLFTLMDLVDPQAALGFTSNALFAAAAAALFIAWTSLSLRRRGLDAFDVPPAALS